MYINGNKVEKTTDDTINDYNSGSSAIFCNNVTVEPGDVVEIRNAVLDDVLGTKGKLKALDNIGVLFKYDTAKKVKTDPVGIVGSYNFGSFRPWSTVSLSKLEPGYEYDMTVYSSNENIYPMNVYHITSAAPIVNRIDYCDRYVVKESDVPCPLYGKDDEMYKIFPFISTSDIDDYNVTVSFFEQYPGVDSGFSMEFVASPYSIEEITMVDTLITGPAIVRGAATKYPGRGNSFDITFVE